MILTFWVHRNTEKYLEQVITILTDDSEPEARGCGRMRANAKKLPWWGWLIAVAIVAIVAVVAIVLGNIIKSN